MTEVEISERFGVTRRTVRRWRKDGFPPAVAELISLYEGEHPDWPGFKIQAGIIHTPNGYSLSANEIQLQPWIINNYRTLFARSEAESDNPDKDSSIYPKVEIENSIRVLHADSTTKH